MPLGGVLGASIGVIVVLGVTYYFLSLARRRACGFWPWEVGRIRREGTRAMAQVLSRTYRPTNETGIAEYELIVEVRPAGTPSFRAQVTYAGEKLEEGNREGAQLPVLFHPGHPSRLLIDFASVEHAKKAAASEQQARDEQHKRDLLAGKGP